LDWEASFVGNATGVYCAPELVGGHIAFEAKYNLTSNEMNSLSLPDSALQSCDTPYLSRMCRWGLVRGELRASNAQVTHTLPPAPHNTHHRTLTTHRRDERYNILVPHFLKGVYKMTDHKQLQERDPTTGRITKSSPAAAARARQGKEPKPGSWKSRICLRL